MADLTGMLQAAAGVSTGNPNAWDISKAYYDVGADAGNLSKAFYTSLSYQVGSQESFPGGLFFHPDGTKMYVCGSSSDSVHEYSLSTAWVVSSASFVRTFSVSSQDNDTRGLAFKSDGTKMFVAGSQNDSIYEYALSTAWDISTASYTTSFSIASQGSTPRDLAFKSDGTKMYYMDNGNDEIYEYSLSTAWDVSSASYTQAFSVTSQETEPAGLAFNGDGTKMYVCGATGDDVNEYSLSTAWNISTASYVRNFSVASEESNPSCLFFKSEGDSFFVAGLATNTVFQYGIGGFSIATEESNPTGVFFKPDGTKVYVCGTTGDDVNEYSLSTAWDIRSASYVQNFSVASQDGAPLDLFFKDDGTKMYIIGTGNDSIYEYTLSVAWDVSSASYITSFSVASQDGAPQGLSFKIDGTKVYVAGSGGDSIYEYALSTAWDISSASYVQSFSVASQDSSPTGLFFRPNGLQMYITASTNDAVFEYSLSSAWDISTASYVQTFSVKNQASIPGGIAFKDDGMGFVVIDSFSDKLFSYLILEE